MPQPFQSGNWYLLRVAKAITEKKGDKPAVAVLFECVSGPSIGATFSDDFYLTEKAITRLETLCHRSGVEVAIKKPDDVTLDVLVALVKSRVYAHVIEDPQYKRIKTDGWMFRPETDPPDEESFIDYKAQDDEERALEGL